MLFRSVADTFYYWDTQALSEEKNIWLKVTGYSADKTLINSSVIKLRSKFTAINTTEDKEHILIYPNPSTGRFIVEGENIRKIRITDISGRTIFSSLTNLTRQHVDLSTRQRGLYFVEITSDRGAVTLKLILE